jgi:hypothetical protein
MTVLPISTAPKINFAFMPGYLLIRKSQSIAETFQRFARNGGIGR